MNRGECGCVGGGGGAEPHGVTGEGGMQGERHDTGAPFSSAHARHCWYAPSRESPRFGMAKSTVVIRSHEEWRKWMENVVGNANKERAFMAGAIIGRLAWRVESEKENEGS
jgi:hypothetical protein